MNQFYNAFDYERLTPEDPQDDYRTPFQVDRDRILHSAPFRRLQSKTQVFWSGQLDFYRTRLTHSLEVAQIGRSICHHLQHRSELLSDDYYIDSDLVEAACLAHDLGHPPFGHTGERSLNVLMREFGGFEGNAQTLRLATETLFESSNRGMNPTRAFLDSILKYKTLYSELHAPENHFIYDPQFTYLDFTTGGNDFPTEATPGPQRDALKSIECQIMDWADDTAYSLNDLADGIQCGFLSIEGIEAWASDQEALSPESQASLGALIQDIRKGKVESHLGRKIGQYIRASRLAPDSNFLSSLSARHRYRLEIAPAILAECRLFKQLAYQAIFLSPTLKQLEHKAHFLLGRLFDSLRNLYIEQETIQGLHFNILPSSQTRKLDAAPNTESRARIICDFLASLTDPQASRLYQRLFSPESNSITDLIL